MRVAVVLGLLVALFAVGCDTPHTEAVLENDYSIEDEPSLIVYRAHWLNVDFTEPLVPGASSDKESALAASPNTAYALLAPDWDPTSTTPPSSFVVLQSVGGFSLDFNHTLTINVDDSTFAGNCAAHSTLTQAQADFITQLVFAEDFTGLKYDATTCETASTP